MSYLGPGRYARRSMRRTIQRGQQAGIDATRVAESLFVGSRPPDLQRCAGQFEIVVFCAPEFCIDAPAKLEILRAPFGDAEVSPAVAELVEETARLIHSRCPPQRVLVTCRAGFNRSALVAARVLMLRGQSADDAIRTVRTWRGAYALDNPLFVEYLAQVGTNNPNERIASGV